MIQFFLNYVVSFLFMIQIFLIMKYYFMQIQFWIGIRNTNLKKWSISSYYHMVIMQHSRLQVLYSQVLWCLSCLHTSQKQADVPEEVIQCTTDDYIFNIFYILKKPLDIKIISQPHTHLEPGMNFKFVVRKCPRLASRSTSGPLELRCPTCGYYYAHKPSLKAHVRVKIYIEK